MPAAGTPILDVRDLHTQFFTDAGIVRAVDGVTLLGRGRRDARHRRRIRLRQERHRAVADAAARRAGRIVGGEVRFQGRDVLAMNADELRALRGDGIAMVFQDPMTSLNPVLRIARQLVETMRAHGRFDDEQATTRAVSLLGRMGITAPERAINSYPHQFSGGMRQRVMLAMGFANEPALLIADEPTTALDVTIQAQILDLIVELNRDFGAAIILISHALGVIANVCQRVIVMYAGEVVEEGPTEQVLADPRHPYTWALINAVPRIDRHLPGTRRLTTIEGAPPDPLAIPPAAALRRAVRSASKSATSTRRCIELVAGTQGALLGDAVRRTAAAACDRAAGKRRRRRSAGRHEAGRNRAPSRCCRCAALVKHFPLPRDGFFGAKKVVRAVDGVDLDVAAGRDRRRGRRIRLRQVDLRAARRAHPRADRRIDPLRRPGDRRSIGCPRSGRCAAACRWCSRILTPRSTRA